MSRGLYAQASLVAEDDTHAMYIYAGEDWNAEPKQAGDAKRMDGEFIIDKRYLEPAEVRQKRKRTANGRSILVDTLIYHHVDTIALEEQGHIVIRQCKNEATRSYPVYGMSYAQWLIIGIFDHYQREGRLPEKYSKMV